jgi:hypothetical protein
MERREEGIFIANEEIKMAGKILGYIGIGFLSLRLIRLALWPPIQA